MTPTNDDDEDQTYQMYCKNLKTGVPKPKMKYGKFSNNSSKYNDRIDQVSHGTFEVYHVDQKRNVSYQSRMDSILSVKFLLLFYILIENKKSYYLHGNYKSF